jgi:hypothetical protein
MTFFIYMSAAPDVLAGAVRCTCLGDPLGRGLMHLYNSLYITTQPHHICTDRYDGETHAVAEYGVDIPAYRFCPPQRRS